jgi:hypothetical protein
MKQKDVKQVVKQGSSSCAHRYSEGDCGLMSVKRQSRPRKWGNLLVTAETYEFLSSLNRKGASRRKTTLRPGARREKHSVGANKPALNLTRRDRSSN